MTEAGCRVQHGEREKEVQRLSEAKRRALSDFFCCTVRRGSYLQRRGAFYRLAAAGEKRACLWSLMDTDARVDLEAARATRYNYLLQVESWMVGGSLLCGCL